MKRTLATIGLTLGLASFAAAAGAGNCLWSGATLICNDDSGGQTRYWRDGNALRYESSPGAARARGFGSNPYVMPSIGESVTRLQQQQADLALTRARTEELKAQTEERRLLIELMRRELGVR
jgi:hypothetical protein